MVEIQWKPSELPIDTVIFVDLYQWWIKDVHENWTRIRSWQEGDVAKDDADAYFGKTFEIRAIPPSWYDEWKIFDRNMPQFRINRRGEVRRLSHIEAAKKPASITEALVRRAFNSNPI